jgi:hypothetical protein
MEVNDRDIADLPWVDAHHMDHQFSSRCTSQQLSNPDGNGLTGRDEMIRLATPDLCVSRVQH